MDGGAGSAFFGQPLTATMSMANANTNNATTTILCILTLLS